MNVFLIVGFVIIGFHRHSFGTEGVVCRNKLFCNGLIFNSLTNLAGNEVGQILVRLLTEQEVAKTAKPDAITGLVV